MKQIGLAAINFQSSKQRFPTGGGNFTANTADPNGFTFPQIESGSWAFQILPQLEQENLFNDRATDRLFWWQRRYEPERGCLRLCFTWRKNIRWY